MVLFHEVAELGEAGGLLEVGVGAEFEAAFDVAIFGGGAEDDGGNDAAFRVIIDPFEEFKSSAARHFEVGDDGARERVFFAVGVGSGAFDVFDGVSAVGGNMHGQVEAVFGESALKQECIVGIVFS